MGLILANTGRLPEHTKADRLCAGALAAVLLSLEAYSLLVGSSMVLIALSAVMYATRNLNWSGRSGANEPAAV